LFDLTNYLARPSELFSNFTFVNGRLINPAGESYIIGRVDEPPVFIKDGKRLKVEYPPECGIESTPSPGSLPLAYFTLISFR
jgi:hypothetical protein